MYPGKITDKLIQEFKTNPKLCRYFDIPIQHISDNMLKAMNRHTSKKEIYSLIKKIREEMPDSVIRTTVMTGYQGETEADFWELMDAVKALKFDRLGSFTFSKEEDTKADKMSGDIPESVKKDRLSKIMNLQKEVIAKKQKENIGREIEILVEDVSEDEKYFVCRSYMDAPDVDPKMLIDLKSSSDQVIIGEWYMAEITGTSGYDYICKLK